MKKIRLEIEVEYDDEIMHSDDADSRSWFLDQILGGGGGGLILHSNEIGDEIGPVTVIRHLP